ncbi:MAG: hypothetical protein INF43_03495 [Alphaproteobacteria bacterium]|jgi:hypothetical protein|nr:hypothetical protein [Alphaproteobacteria bacterium]
MKISRRLTALVLGLFASTAYASSCGCSSSQLTYDALAQAESLQPAAVMQPASWWPWAPPRYAAARREAEAFMLTYAAHFNADYAALTPAERAQHYQVLDHLRQARIRHVERLADLIAQQRHDPRAVAILRAHASSLAFSTTERRTFLADGHAWMVRAEASPDAVLRLAAQRVREGCTKAGNPALERCFAVALQHTGATDPGHLTSYALPSGPLTNLVARWQQLEQGALPLTAAVQTASR